MELRQLRYFVRIVELGSMGRAAADLGVVTSALSQQISRLESELATRLLVRTAAGAKATDAGLAFFRQAQLALRHLASATQEAKSARLSGEVSVGFAPSTAAMLALPFIEAMRRRYPEIGLRVVESLSGHLGTMLAMRQLDLAILFDAMPQRISVVPLLDERLFVIASPDVPHLPRRDAARIADLGTMPLVLPSPSHGLRRIVDAAFARAGRRPAVVLEIDGLPILMDVVAAGRAATIQPGAAIVRIDPAALRVIALTDRTLRRRNVLASLSDDELSPAGLAARVTLAETAGRLVHEGAWTGATLHES